MSEEKKKEKEEDPRLEYMKNIILKSHKLKLDRWQKLLGNDDYRVWFLYFCFYKSINTIFLLIEHNQYMAQYTIGHTINNCK